jgi:enoyl-CoA hydratase
MKGMENGPSHDDATYPDLKLCFDEGLAVLILSRPKQLNALNSSLLEQIDKALDEIEAKAEIRVLLITGSGPKAFAAGADISELRGLSTEQGKRLSRRGQRLFERLEKSRLFVIAGINGFALGGGLELALACDMRVMAHSAMVGLPEVSLGIIPGYGGTQRMTRLVGPAHAMELITTGRKIDSHHAWRIGLVNHVVPSEKLLETSRNIAFEVLENAPLSISAAKRSVRAALEGNVSEGYHVEAREFATLCTTKDVEEGMKAFFEKRKAEFKGQ